MKTKSVYVTLFSLAMLIWVSGCASFKIQPDAASITVPKASSPIPVTVGITHVEQKVSGGFPDLVFGLKKDLDESGLFQTVYYPLRSADQLDGGLELHLNARLRADSALFPKAFLTGFFMFLPAPLVSYNHQYQIECTMDLTKGDRKLKSYTAKAAVTVSHKLLASPDRMEAEGTEAAAKLLGSQLVEQLVSDRAFIETQLTTPKAEAGK